MDETVIDRRFCGPPDSGNGGYAAGTIARALLEGEQRPLIGSHAVTVTLRMPPPLATSLAVRRTDGAADLVSGNDLVAAATLAAETPVAVEPVDHELAAEAATGFPGLTYHPFPTCFGCGTGRTDGLRIFPGSITPSATGSGRVAAPWTPAADLPTDAETGRVAYEVLWSALDCTGGWASDFGDRLMVLGRMTAGIDRLPVIGEPYVVVGEALGQDGRKSYAAVSLFDADGRIVGTAAQTWIGVDPGTFGIAPKEAQR